MNRLTHCSLSTWLAVVVPLSLTACVYDPPEGWARPGRDGLYSAREGREQFRPDLTNCVSRFDAQHLPIVQNGGDYPMTGWFVQRNRIDPVRTCLIRKGWTPYPL